MRNKTPCIQSNHHFKIYVEHHVPVIFGLFCTWYFILYSLDNFGSSQTWSLHEAVKYKLEILLNGKKCLNKFPWIPLLCHHVEFIHCICTYIFFHYRFKIDLFCSFVPCRSLIRFFRSMDTSVQFLVTSGQPCRAEVGAETLRQQRYPNRPHLSEGPGLFSVSTRSREAGGQTRMWVVTTNCQRGHRF